MPNTPTLRLITAVDAPAYKAFQVTVCRETDFLTWTGNEVAAKEREYFTRYILNWDRTPWVFWLIAEEEGKIVGDVRLEGSDLTRVAHSARLYIALCKSHWGTGLAKRMVREAEKWAKQNGMTQLTLEVMAGNARAMSFYRRAGFVEDGVRKSRYKINGSAVDEIAMRKDI